MTQFKITDVRARETIDGRGTPAVEVDIWVDSFLRGRADVPSGRSTGRDTKPVKSAMVVAVTVA